MVKQNCHVFVTRKISPQGMDLLERNCSFRFWSGPENAGPDFDTILREVQNCKVLLSLLTEQINRPILEANKKLLGVANFAVGFDNIDVEAASSLGIPITNTPGVLTETTADMAWALLMAIARRIPQAHNYMVSGKYKIWGPNLFLGDDIGTGPKGEAKTLGIIGFGRIGQAVHRRAKGFNMRIIVFDPWVKAVIEKTEGVEYSELPELLEQSDFVTLHCNLSRETHHLIGKEELRSMKRTSYLINTSRGPVVNEKELVWALQHQIIAGAGLDVYEEEPAMAEGLVSLDNVVILPHIASASRATRGEMAMMAARNALALLRKDQAPNTVNPEVYNTKMYQMRIQ